MTTPQNNIPTPDMIGRVVRLTIKPIAALKYEASENKLADVVEYVGVLNIYALGETGIYALSFGPREIVRVHPGLQDLTFEVRVN